MNVVIWSKYHCPYCDQAKSFLKNKGIDFEERKIGDGWTKEDLLEALPSAKSVPQIFIDDKYIGGFQNLVEYLK
jgi:glutaredoxin 3